MDRDTRIRLTGLHGSVAGLTALGILFLLFAWTRRDPDRLIPDDEDLVLSPADGVVTAIVPVDDGEFVRRVSIYLSPLDVHVNRAPVSGRITDIRYRSGRRGNVLRGNASAENEQNWVRIEGSQPPVVFVQIAGMLARRIIFQPALGDWVERGQRVGSITFGSQVDLYLGPEQELLVEPGQRVRAGCTPLGRQRGPRTEGSMS